MSFSVNHVPQPKYWDHNRLSTTIVMKPGRPVDPIAFAKMIIAIVERLESEDRKESPDGQKRFEWCLIESGVVGKSATFTLQGYPKSQIDTLKSTKAPKPPKAGAP